MRMHNLTQNQLICGAPPNRGRERINIKIPAIHRLQGNLKRGGGRISNFRHWQRVDPTP